jgi:hypothetical protein
MFPKRTESGSLGDVTLVTRLLDVVEHQIVPLTREGVAGGNKLFGATHEPEEVFGVADGGYRRSNAFWTAYGLADLVESLPEDDAVGPRGRLGDLRSIYDELSAGYQATKDGNDIPLR